MCASPSEPSFTDRIVAHCNSTPNFSKALTRYPTAKVAVVTCMDSRIEMSITFGIKPGEAHIIRNAGGLITTDTLRSLSLSQMQMGTREIVLIHHSDCGLHNTDEDGFKRNLVAKVGRKPLFALGAFDDPFEDVYLSAQEIFANPFIPYTDQMRGFVYCVESGLIEEVDLHHPPQQAQPSPQ